MFRRGIEAECGKRQVFLVGYKAEGCPRLPVIPALIAGVARAPQSLSTSCLKSLEEPWKFAKVSCLQPFDWIPEKKRTLDGIQR